MSQKVKALSEEQSVRLVRKHEGKESGFCSKKKQQFLEDGIKSRLGPGGIFLRKIEIMATRNPTPHEKALLIRFI